MGVRKSVAALALLALLVSAGLFGGASSAGAASPAITFSLSCSPPIVSPGDEWGCSGTIANDGPQTATHLTLFEEIAGADLVHSSFSVASACTPLADGGTSCELGNIAADATITFATVFTTSPLSSGTLSNAAHVSFDERASDQDRGKQDTVCANTGAPKPCADLESTELVSSGNLDLAGGYVAFAGDDTIATPDARTTAQNVSTAASIPFRGDDFANGFGATIVERDPAFAGEGCGTGFSCFGQIVIETLAGQFATDDPAVVTFQLVVPKGKNAKNILVFHNGGGPEPTCLAEPLSGTNDTCVQSVSQNSKTKVVTIVVHSTDNGGWGFG
jgi:hypothetical protein